MQLFKTPFSRAYWQYAVRDAKKLRTLVFSALMVAACVALARLDSLPVVNNIKVTWGFLARALCALVGGPVNALLFGVVEDTVGYLMQPGGASGGYNPFYILTTVLGVFTYALFFYRAEVTVLRVFLAKLATNLQNVFLGGLGTYLFYSSKGYWAIVGAGAGGPAGVSVRCPAAHPPPHGLPARPGVPAEAVEAPRLAGSARKDAGSRGGRALGGIGCPA